ncbi:cadherin-related tumor suppressor [Caerostris extrusa]|uniref:Cadherin-related tumor suppressor n=1 Tax=Caerostris extrusa TaxID=172846 RepID=A0AAV4XA96_CAEEX|nr:cadherin-related tumor suppressor [Caerostris extrusa]
MVLMATFNIPLSKEMAGVFSLLMTLQAKSLFLKPLDRESTAHYILTVMARDLGEDISHNTTALVSIDVLDENDNVPRFDNATTKLINISENAIVGSRIFTFSASDSDLGVNAEITFSVASGNFKETFRIDGPSGSLYLARPLDYEDKNNYILNVSASDGGTPKLTTTIKVVIKILDVNDNAPRFSSTAVVRQIEESIPPNTPVVTLTAQDRDSGVNGKSFLTSHIKIHQVIISPCNLKLVSCTPPK